MHSKLNYKFMYKLVFREHGVRLIDEKFNNENEYIKISIYSLINVLENFNDSHTIKVIK